MIAHHLHAALCRSSIHEPMPWHCGSTWIYSGQRAGPARHRPVKSMARWGSSQQGTTCLPGHPSQGHGPGLRPRHDTMSRFSCRAGLRSTANFTGRASPRPTGCRQRERGRAKGNPRGVGGRRCSPPRRSSPNLEEASVLATRRIRCTGAGSAAAVHWIRRRREGGRTRGADPPRRRRSAASRVGSAPPLPGDVRAGRRAATSSGRISPAACRGASPLQGERRIPLQGPRELRRGGPRELHRGAPLQGPREREGEGRHCCAGREWRERSTACEGERAPHPCR